ncbi:hypothetical protein SODALDRAFT_300573 [Sodiomyces alkalinus F11]|uniref:Acyl-coenzyme A diphosphatase SCS3 n=1 Tax=Sodiomyces alkalinus (strain CBS 110278 / VKM F-3762 / F11) TaxID=1314773 RepID=A0A3N2PNX3_SODAK|nr:hypothetical protein SODALDRAFT_300573 [Sodiomyces alkalinus F11]ROT36193.1 hypothetical protein SODALDRAFT_300573 [Sodiomyces alkalinus F11]
MDDTPPSTNLRSSAKTRRALAEERHAMSSSSPSSPYPPSTATTGSLVPTRRNSPFLPTPLETAILALFPALLAFGTLFSVLSPQVRRAEFDPTTQSHAQHPDEAPGYFARKDNLLNVFFVKRGWFWTTVAFAAFVLTHPTFRGGRGAGGGSSPKRFVTACTRWALITGAWFAATQWCFGPPLIDRHFMLTGGRCEVVLQEARELEKAAALDTGHVLSALACKSAGGAWKGGHDISGHVFMLVLSSGFLLSEVGWVYWRHRGRRDDRSIVMHDRAVKGAGVEADSTTERTGGRPEDALALGGKAVAVVVGLNCWMLLMTAIYFHTWFEKVTGLVASAIALYAVYILPRFVPALRQIVGLPGA